MDEAVVLFGGHAGERLEPVGEVRRAVLQGPDLHAVGDVVCDVERERRTRAQAALPCLERGAGYILLHSGLIKYVAAKQFRDLFFRLHECFLLANSVPERQRPASIRKINMHRFYRKSISASIPQIRRILFSVKCRSAHISQNFSGCELFPCNSPPYRV